MTNIIIPFKNRTIDINKPVFIYRKLDSKAPHKIYSIKQNGKVVAHTTCLLISDAQFIISRSGQARVRKERIKNVHAFIKGFISDKTHKNMRAIVTYNPYHNASFICSNLGTPPFYIKSAKLVLCDQHGVSAENVVTLTDK